LNWVLHIVAMVPLGNDGGRSKTFLDKCRLRGKSQRSALRVLKTYIARELFSVMHHNIRANIEGLSPWQPYTRFNLRRSGCDRAGV